MLNSVSLAIVAHDVVHKARRNKRSREYSLLYQHMLRQKT